MRQPSLTPLQQKLDNKYPDCLYIQLTGSLAQLDKSSQPFEFNLQSQINQQAAELIDLYLTIRFGIQRQQLAGGTIAFGIKSGVLRLKLRNGRISSELQELAGSLELSLQQERQAQEVHQKQKGTEVSLSDFLLFLAGNKTEAQENKPIEPKSDPAEKFQFTPCQITIQASEQYPAWHFEEKMDESVLKGILKNAKLATLNVIAKPCYIEATFEVSKRDIRLIEAEGLWPPNISRNKRVILERLILLRVLEPKFKPYLSRQELQFSPSTVIPEGAGDSNGTKR